MKQFIFSFLFFSLILSAFGQDQIVFNKTYNNFSESGSIFSSQLYNNDYTQSVLPLGNGYVIGGHSENFLWADSAQQKDDAFYLKVNLFGDTLWTKSFGVNAAPIDDISDIMERNDKLYFVGITEVDTNNSIPIFNSLLFKTEGSGSLVFHTEYDFLDFEFISKIINHNQYLIILYNKESYDLSYSEPCLSKIDSNGNIIWNYCYGDTTSFFGLGWIKVINNEIYCTGAIKDSNDTYSFSLFKTDTNGLLLESFNFPSISGNIVRSGNGGNTGYYYDENGMHIVMTGLIELSPSNNAGYLISVDENGAKEWEKIIDPGSANEAFLSAQILEDGRIVTISKRNNYENNSANDIAWIVMLDKHGELIWERFLSPYSDLNAYTYPYQVKTTLDRGFAITGYVINNQIQTNGIFNRNDAWLCKTDSCGYTVGAQPEAQFTIDSVIGNQVYISNSSSEYCTGNLAIQIINSTTNDTIELDSLHLYAYSQWTNGEDPTQVVYTLPDTGKFIFNLIAYAGDGIDSFSTSIQVSDTATSLVSVNQTVLDCSVYPNPSFDFFIISRSSQDLSSWSGSIYNIQGQLVHEFTLPKDVIQHRFILPALSNGIYILNLENNLGARNTQKISVYN